MNAEKIVKEKPGTIVDVRMKISTAFLILSIATFFGCNSNTSSTNEKVNSVNSSPKIIGAMKNVMWKGELFGTIDIDTISNKQHLYGLGPLENLTGEIIIVDGKGYKSEVVNDTAMKVTETFAMKAPFFGYATVESWTQVQIPDSISTTNQLEHYLNQSTKNNSRPFFFKLTATVESAAIHIVNLPNGTKVSTPNDVFRWQKKYEIKNQAVDLLGFFSTEHATIFTHHDTFVHLHLITDDKKQMGHLEEMNIKKGTAKLYLPIN